MATMLSLLFCHLTQQITSDRDITAAPVSGHSYWTGHKTKAELSLKPVGPTPSCKEMPEEALENGAASLYSLVSI